MVEVLIRAGCFAAVILMGVLLRQAGFRQIKQYGELRMTPPRAGEGRIFFAARKDT